MSLQRQSEYRAISERIAYDNPRVVAFSQYLLRDDPPKPACPLIARYPGFESGLFTYAASPSRRYDGFRLPLAVRRSGSKVSLWGLVRPATGVTTASDRVPLGRRLVPPLHDVTTDARGYFTKSSALRRPDASGAWCGRRPTAPPSSGTPTRAYK